MLLSSLEGAAITSVKITGANHEFQTLPHVVEDVTDIVLNLKKVKFKANDHEIRNLHISREQGRRHHRRRHRRTPRSAKC